jgi:hypothetical protein
MEDEEESQGEPGLCSSHRKVALQISAKVMSELILGVLRGFRLEIHESTIGIRDPMTWYVVIRLIQAKLQSLALARISAFRALHYLKASSLPPGSFCQNLLTGVCTRLDLCTNS